MDKKKIMVIDDDTTILNFLSEFLSSEGFVVYTAADGSTALELCRQKKPDLVVLDVMMPEMDGFETCLQMRRISTVPIVFLSAKHETSDRVMGLACGSDDFVAKPFDSGELLLRIKAILRRSRGGVLEPDQDQLIKLAGLTINRTNRSVEKLNRNVELTAKEFELLWLLASYPKRVFTRDQLIYQIWNQNFLEDTSVVTMLVKRLREKIEDDHAKPVYIKTIRGVGYKFGWEPNN